VNAHERQQFDMLLQTAVDRYAERLIQRNDDAENARTRLLETPEAEGVWLSGFVDAVFQDSLLDNTAGACFVVEALERRPAPSVPALIDICASAAEASATSASSAAEASAPSAAAVSASPRIGDVLSALARSAFAMLLRQKTAEELARRASFQSSVPSAAASSAAAPSTLTS
jgi:hypothetical protein